MATEKVQILIDAKNNATAQLKSVNQELSRMDKAASMAVRGFAALGGVMALQQGAKFALEMAQLNTQIERSTYAFEHFSGGAAQAAANMRAVQRASGGAIDSLSAQNIAVTAMTQGLASNSVELERITRIARGIVSVSPIINDLESAFSQLGLTIANQSMMRLDQLGTSAAEIKPKIEALKKANKDLTDEQAFQAALLGTLEAKFNSLTGAAVNQASGLERLAVSWKEYRNSASSAFAWVDDVAGGLADALDQQTKFDFGKWIAGQMGNPEVIGELSYAQKQIVSKLKEITDLSYLDKLKMGDQYSIQVADLVDQYFKLGDAFARTSQKFDAMMNVIDPSSIQGPQGAPDNYWTSYTEGMSSAIAENAKAAKKAIAEVTEAQARAAQNRALAQTGDYDFAQSEYDRAKQAARELIATNAELGRSATDLVPVFSTLLGDAIGTDYTDNIAELRKQVFGLIETLARAEQSDFVFGGGDALQSIEVYNDALAKLRSLVGSGDFNLGSLEDLETLLNVLPGMFQNVGIAAGDTAGEFDILANSIDRVYRVASTMGEAFQDATQGVAKTVSDFLGELIDISEVTETQARAAQNQALAQTGDYDFAQSEYERVKQAAKELIATNVELGRSVTDLVPIFGTLLDNAIDTDYTDSIAELRKQVFELIETLARAEQRDFVLGGGDALQSIEVYNDALAKLRSLVGSGDFNLGGLEDLKTLLNVLPGMLRNAGVAAENAAGGFDILATAMRGVVSIMGKIDGAMQGTASTVAGFLANLADMTGDIQMELFSIGADFGQGLEGGRDFTAQMLPEVQQMVVEWGLAGATLEEITQVLLPNYLSDLESANAELYATGKSVKTIDSGFESLKNTVAGIVSGAIGPVAGVDADDLLPRPDAVNENARRLADIAVNGFKGQDWLDEFAFEVPDVFEELKNSSDPKGTAAQILKDFQDGLRPDLIDKDRAKELVKRALQGDANTKALVDEIAGELASELGISLSEAKAKAGEVLSGDTGSALDVSFAPTIDKTAAVEAAGSFSAEFMSAIESGVLDVSFTPTIDNTAAIEAVSSFAAAFTSAVESGVFDMSLAPTIDNTAASGAASSFAAAFTSAIEGSTLGADMSGAIFTQVTASVALIEESGKEAGRALVRGVTATFTDIPAAFIAAVASLVTPSVVAAMANNGGRTGAAAS